MRSIRSTMKTLLVLTRIVPHRLAFTNASAMDADLAAKDRYITARDSAIGRLNKLVCLACIVPFASADAMLPQRKPAIRLSAWRNVVDRLIELCGRRWIRLRSPEELL